MVDLRCVRFHAADIIIGVTGAGLVNILCARSTSVVVELIPRLPPPIEFQADHFLALATHLGLGYHGIFLSTGTSAALLDEVESFSVDVEQLRQALLRNKFVLLLDSVHYFEPRCKYTSNSSTHVFLFHLPRWERRGEEERRARRTDKDAGQ